MNILVESERFTAEQIEKVEARHGAKYVCETCVKNTYGNWVNQSVSIFYQPVLSKVPMGGSQWFGLFYRQEIPQPDVPYRLFVVNAISAVEQDIDGIVAKNGDVIYSRYRHDDRTSPDKSVTIDGGRDYTHYDTVGPLVTLRIVRDKLTLVEDGA